MPYSVITSITLIDMHRTRTHSYPISSLFQPKWFLATSVRLWLRYVCRWLIDTRYKCVRMLFPSIRISIPINSLQCILLCLVTHHACENVLYVNFRSFFFILTISISFCNDIAVFSCKTSGRVQSLRYLLVHDVKHLRADNVYHRVLCH